MKALVILWFVGFIFVMTIGGYYYHLNHVKLTTPRPIFKCSKTTHIEDDKPVRVWIANCKRNGRTVTF